MIALVSLDEAKDQLFLSQDQAEHDVAIDRTMQLATGIVMDYVGLIDPVTEVARGWTTATVPDPVKAAILELIANMWAHRGDEEQPLSVHDLPPRIRAWLTRYREQVVA